MTNTTAIATPAAPQRQVPAGSDRARKEAAANGPSFDTVMRSQRGGADQGRARGAAPGETDTLATTGTDASNTETGAPGDAEHLRGLSSLHRRDWHAQLKRLASGEDQPQQGEQAEPIQADMSAEEGHAPALRHKRAANSNVLPATSVPEAASETSEDMPKVTSNGHDDDLSVKTEKPGKHQPDAKADLRTEASPDNAVLSPADQLLAPDASGGAEARAEGDAGRSAATSSSTADGSKALDGENEKNGQSSSPSTTAQASTATPHSTRPVQTQAAPAPVKTEGTPVAPGFTVEMTVAAANYALASGNAAQGTDQGPSETTEVGAETPSAERPRVTILPTSAQVAAPGLSSATFSMPQAFIADDQARQSAEALGAREEIKTLGADKAADDNPRTKAEPETGAAIQSRAPSMQGPAMQQTPASPAATVVAALAADPAARPQPISPLAQVLSSPSATEPKTLTIQLHPAELGVVYATFHMTDGQMSVEISAETDDARSRLAAESHTIAKSLRSLGIDVDQVTVMQTTTPAPTVARADDAAAQNMPSARDQQSSFGAQTSGGGGSRLGGQQNGRDGHDMAGAGHDHSSAADRGDGGVYI